MMIYFWIFRFIERREESNAKELAESYTESSINAFKTILRVKTDWEVFKTEMVHTTDIGKHDFINNVIILVKKKNYYEKCFIF